LLFRGLLDRWQALSGRWRHPREIHAPRRQPQLGLDARTKRPPQRAVPRGVLTNGTRRHPDAPRELSLRHLVLIKQRYQVDKPNLAQLVLSLLFVTWGSVCVLHSNDCMPCLIA
jgi:hypothetical protein